MISINNPNAVLEIHVDGITFITTAEQVVRRMKETKWVGTQELLRMARRPKRTSPRRSDGLGYW